jgi:outer membrane receptor protein involved in Fe transport
MAGHRGLIPTVSRAWRFAWLLCLALLAVETSAGEPQAAYDIDLPGQGVADALNSLSAQAGVPIVFPYDLARGRRANPIFGHYTLRAALDELLKGTGLSGGLSDKGVLMISLAKSEAAERGETIVTHENKPVIPKNRHSGMAAILASVTAAFSASAHAADDAGEQMANVVITAQKREERLQDVPVPVTALNGAQLADNGQVLLRDYFSSVPGLNVSPNYGGQQMPSIRGITTGGFTTPTVGAVVDDVPFGTSTFWAGNQVPDIDPGDLARIEVLRGPQGTLYGANSMGGLLKFVTVDPSTSAYSGRLEAGTEYVHNGAAPGYNIRGSVNVPLTDTLAIRASGFTRQDPGYIDNPFHGDQGVNEGRSSGARLAGLWQIADGLSLKLSGLYQQMLMNGSSDVGLQPGLADLQQNYIHGIGGYDRKISAFSAILKARLGGAELTSVTAYGINNFSASLDFTSVFGPPVKTLFGVNGSSYIDADNATKFSQEVRLAGHLTENVDWLVGGFFTHENAPDKELFTAQVPETGQIVGTYWYITFPTRYQEYAGFADLTYHFTDQFDVQVGGRESHITTTTLPQVGTGPFVGPTPSVTPQVDNTANAFTYLVTPRFKLTSDLMVYARFASGYRPGGPQAAAVVAQGAPSAYAPDKTKNYELGLKADFFEHALSLDASLYYIDWKNLQIQLKTADGIAYNANGGGAKSEGAELEIMARPLKGLSLSAWVSYDNAVLTENFPSSSTAYGASGDRLPNSARWSSNGSAQQDFALWGGATGYVGVTATYVGDRVSVFMGTANRQTFPSYTKADLRAGVVYESWRLNAYANNVGDKRGVLNGGIGFTPAFAFDYIQPRTIGASLVKTF